MIGLERSARRVSITLDDPARRNALSSAMFDALEAALRETAAGHDERSGALILRIRGAGSAFCSGFDLGACAGDDGQRVLGSFIERLSGVIRTIRRGPWVAVAQVHGAALAGGCALVAACDFAIVSETAQLGYPVHRLGVSPAVNAPLVVEAMGAGPARALLLSGELISGAEAKRRGLATHAVAEAELASKVDDLCDRLGRKGPRALLETRRLLDRLDGSRDDAHFDRAVRASADLCGTEESARMLRAARVQRRA